MSKLVQVRYTMYAVYGFRTSTLSSLFDHFNAAALLRSTESRLRLSELLERDKH